jgi:hypothetical protein
MEDVVVPTRSIGVQQQLNDWELAGEVGDGATAALDGAWGNNQRAIMGSGNDAR